ncbi:MAG: AMP-binding protein [Gammaproteobacteria bacterium]
MNSTVIHEPHDRTRSEAQQPSENHLDTGFSWAAARHGELAGPARGLGVNIAYEAVGRHVDAGHGDQPALIAIAPTGPVERWTYTALDWGASKVARRLRALGFGPQDRVFTLLGPCPALFLTALGTWKNRGVLCPLFSAFGPEPIEQRMNLGQAKVLVTTTELYRRKIAPIRDRLSSLEQVLLVGGVAGVEGHAGVESFGVSMLAGDGAFENELTSPDEVALLHFTSGTTGAPKAALHVHDAVLAHRVTARTALDICPGDVYWCTADPGRMTGVPYGIIAPLAAGATVVVDEADFDAARWLRILNEHEVNVWYTAPTAVRRLMHLDASVFDACDFPALRFIASAGEPLDPRAVTWAERAFGLPVHDNWWQTETGAIMIGNTRGKRIKPGSMGRPLPGIEAVVMQRRPDGGVEFTTGPDARGELVLRPGWPSMFRGYLNDQERYRHCFEDGWYLTGDLVTVDADGYYWFMGRASDPSSPEPAQTEP